MKIRELERDHKKKVKAQEAADLRIEQLNDNKDTKFAQIGVATALVVVGLFAGIFHIMDSGAGCPQEMVGLYGIFHES